MAENQIFLRKRWPHLQKTCAAIAFHLFAFLLFHYFYGGAVGLTDDVQALLQVVLADALQVVDFLGVGG